MLDTELLGTKEFELLCEIKPRDQVIILLESSDVNLEHVYTDYFTEKKKRMEELKEVPEYKELSETIKAIKKAESERIKPETALFRLTIEILKAHKTGGSVDFLHNDKYKKAVKTCGQGYVTEFCDKNDSDLKDFIARYHILKGKIEEELAENTEYQRALSRKKDLEYEIEVDLKDMELSAKLALLVLKNRKVENIKV